MSVLPARQGLAGPHRYVEYYRFDSLYEPWTKFVVRGLKESVIRMVRLSVGYWRE